MIRRLLTVVTLAFTLSCQEEAEFKYISVATTGVSYTEGASATFHGIVENKSGLKLIESGFHLSLRSQDSYGVKLISDDSNEGFFIQQTTDDLLSGKTYFYRAYAIVGEKTIYGPELSFKTTGEVNTGEWHLEVDGAETGWCQRIQSAFSLGDHTYFLLQEIMADGGYGKEGLYSLNNQTRNFDFLMNNEIISQTQFNFVYEGNAYLFSGDRFYRFNPEEKSLTGLSPLSKQTFATGFIIRDAIYMGLGSVLNNFWKYSLLTDTWKPIQNFPGQKRPTAFSFTVGDVGYVGGGNSHGLFYQTLNDFWGYDPESDTWVSKQNFPNSGAMHEYDYPYECVNGNCYYRGKLFEYNLTFNFWEQLKPIVDKYPCDPVLLLIDGQLRLVSLDYDRNNDRISMSMWRYEK